MITFSKLTAAFLVIGLCASTAFGMEKESGSTSSALSTLEQSQQFLAEMRNCAFYTIDDDGRVYVNSPTYVNENRLPSNYEPGYGVRRDDLTERIQPALTYEQWIKNVAFAAFIAMFTMKNQQQAHCG